MNLAYPLHWPAGYPRHEGVREAAMFTVTQDTAQLHLVNELSLLGAESVTISTNIPIRQDGLPYARYGKISDPGVAVYFWLDGEERVFACDRWRSVRDNIRAIGKTVEALRGIARWGSHDMMRSAFSGFSALPAGAVAAPRPWWQVLGVREDADWADVQRAFRERVMAAHPDRGGTHEAFVEIQRALDDAKRELGR